MDAALRWVRDRVEHGVLPSAVFGVATSAGTQLIEAFSGIDDRPAHTDDLYALYSVTKPLSGIAVGQAVERGELSLRQDLGSVVEAAAGPAQPWRNAVRLEHLLSHTGGLIDPALDDPRDLDAQLATAAANFSPGTMLKYSNISFHAAAKMLTRATGRSLQSDVEALAPGLTFDPHADAHRVFGQERVGMDHRAMSAHRHPAAGANGTAEALLSLGASLLRALGGARGEVLHPETIRGMLTPRTLGLPEAVPSDPRRDFGLTWNVRNQSTALLHRDAFGHEGWSSTQWWIYPQLDLTFVLLTNVLDARSLGVDPDELNNAVVSGS